MTVEPGYRSRIRRTMLGDHFEQYAPGLSDQVRMVADLVGEVTWHDLKGSSGWMRLIELGIQKSVEQQVRSALGSFTSESGKQHLRIEDFVSSALSSLREDVEKASQALKWQSKRAKKYLSATAYGLAGKPKRPKVARIKTRLTAQEVIENERQRKAAARRKRGKSSTAGTKWTRNLGKK
jgi:hypothetical protein